MVSKNKALIFNFSREKKIPKRHHFHDPKGLKFHDQILQTVAIL